MSSQGACMLHTETEQTVRLDIKYCKLQLLHRRSLKKRRKESRTRGYIVTSLIALRCGEFTYYVICVINRQVVIFIIRRFLNTNWMWRLIYFEAEKGAGPDFVPRLTKPGVGKLRNTSNPANSLKSKLLFDVWHFCSKRCPFFSTFDNCSHQKKKSI